MSSHKQYYAISQVLKKYLAERVKETHRRYAARYTRISWSYKHAWKLTCDKSISVKFGTKIRANGTVYIGVELIMNNLASAESIAERAQLS